MTDFLYQLLESRGFPVYRQGSLNSASDYPDSFYTYWNYDTPETGFYNNQAHKTIWGYWVYFYATNPQLLEAELNELIKELKKNGCILPDGRGLDVDSGNESHVGRMITVQIMEVNDNE